ncbi:protein kinase domain-containing protein [Paenibacillus mendelii]|uniref:Serine/threonine protein kinase n=1 Tax=Paenibacillus mendelii TaxID=206163 RepID=A0ABV6JIA2_9BACL|nr:serine/threonine protein kinase [Paenibacillus mendelii]MCQ6563710.1 serine/threonine protein kinase [Paenibacillus mendelii]
MITSFEWTLPRGTVIKGKWKRNSYRVERLLGEGANGKVFLVERQRSWYAMKIGADTVDLQSEVNVLQSIAKQRKGSRAEPYLVEVDDMRALDGKEYPFYIMRYIRGATLSDYLMKQGMDWFPVVGYSLLGKLAELHDGGWTFSDVKVENVMVADYGRVELVDYGGVTAMGKSVRQFTEIYDRGYWNAGSRTADARYDLFSFGVLCIQLHESQRLAQLTASLLPQNRMPEELLKLAHANPRLKPLTGWLRQALNGEFKDAREAAGSWRQWMHRPGQRHATPAPSWMKGLFVASAALLATTIYWLLNS